MSKTSHPLLSAVTLPVKLPWVDLKSGQQTPLGDRYPPHRQAVWFWLAGGESGAFSGHAKHAEAPASG
eukprot:3726950-Rhodomonas_salina.2